MLVGAVFNTYQSRLDSWPVMLFMVESISTSFSKKFTGKDYYLTLILFRV